MECGLKVYDINKNFIKMKTGNNSYTQAQRFADITKSFIISGNIRRAKRCVQVAEELFTKGNKEIQNAIANVYLFSLSSFMEIHHCNIRELFPKNLKNEYYKQINTSGI